ncbi:MAG: transposase [Candidatus Moraniibacteriota bacterium]
MRKTPFVDGEYYHVFNRGVEKRDIFDDDADYRRFLLSMLFMNDPNPGLMVLWRDFRIAHPASTVEDFLGTDQALLRSDFGTQGPTLGNVSLLGKPRTDSRKRIVDILAYCLNPNHFHFVLKQNEERGIERFMQRLGTGYTMYYNGKTDRTGALFQGRFKSSHIDSDEYLLHVLAYVDCNSEVHGIAPADQYRWCSFRSWGEDSLKTETVSGRADILGRFKNMAEYHAFAKPAVEGMRERKGIF